MVLRGYISVFLFVLMLPVISLADAFSNAQIIVENTKFPDTKLKTNSPDSAFYLIMSLYQEAEKSNNYELKARCCLELGEVLYYLGDFENANQYLIQSVEYYSNSDSKYFLANAYTWQGIVSQYAKHMHLSLSNYHNALTIYKELNDSLKIGELYGWIGHYYEKSLEADTALYYQRIAVNILNKLDSSQIPMARIYDNIGSIFEDAELYDSAQHYFSKALEINSQTGDINSYIIHLNNLGDVFRKIGNYETSLIFTDSALNLALEHNIPYQARSAHRDFSKIYLQLREFEKAFTHLDQAYDLYSEILNEDNSNRIALLQTIYEYERQENQIKLLEKEQNLNGLLKLVFGIGLVVLLLIGFFVFRYQRTKVKQSNKIIAQNKEIFDKEKELNKLELQNAFLNEEKLKAQIDHQKYTENQLQQNIELKSQLITSQTLQIIRKNNFLERLQNELQSIKKSDKKDRNERINTLMKSISNDISSDENWNDFNMVFSQVHIDFFKKIKQRFPEISPAEMRLCSLLKLNLHSQEIATILGISTDSLRIARYRLRKKLMLGKNDELVGFLTNI